MSVNDTETSDQVGTNSVQRGSRPVRYELIDKNGDHIEEFASRSDAAEYAKKAWPHEPQDPDRTGKGWDIQVVGS